MEALILVLVEGLVALIWGVIWGVSHELVTAGWPNCLTPILSLHETPVSVFCQTRRPADPPKAPEDRRTPKRWRGKHAPCSRCILLSLWAMAQLRPLRSSTRGVGLAAWGIDARIPGSPPIS